MPAIACFMGMKMPLPPGMPKDACWSFPTIFWNLLSEIFYCFKIDLTILQKQILMYFYGTFCSVYDPS